MRWAGHVECIGERGKMFKVSVGNTELKSLLKSLRRRSEDVIRMDPVQIFWELCTGFSWLRIGTGGGLL
jgi:hypothetical protein